MFDSIVVTDGIQYGARGHFAGGRLITTSKISASENSCTKVCQFRVI